MLETKPDLAESLRLEKKRYRTLLEKAQTYTNDICHILNTKVTMFRYPKESITNGSWNLKDLYERTEAARQLGYRVVLRIDEKGLLVEYEKQMRTSAEYFY